MYIYTYTYIFIIYLLTLTLIRDHKKELPAKQLLRELMKKVVQ